MWYPSTAIVTADVKILETLEKVKERSDAKALIKCIATYIHTYLTPAQNYDVGNQLTDCVITEIVDCG